MATTAHDLDRVESAKAKLQAQLDNARLTFRNAQNMRASAAAHLRKQESHIQGLKATLDALEAADKAFDKVNPTTLEELTARSSSIDRHRGGIPTFDTVSGSVVRVLVQALLVDARARTTQGRSAERLVEARQRLAESEESLKVCSQRVEDLAAQLSALPSVA